MKKNAFRLIQGLGAILTVYFVFTNHLQEAILAALFIEMCLLYRILDRVK